ncbi:MAG: LAGLIDADG family homing endonuclease [archaeon]|nr:LAGLIDADG family homing endonuclease [archaeon]
MELSKELTEILGMFAADGCLQKNYICMWGNIFEDKEYYDKIVCPFYSKVFNKKIKAHEKKSNSVYGFYLCDKKVVEFFKDLGFTNNKTYNVRIPKEIMDSENNEIIAAFVRGFADCDGCFSLMRRKGKYKLFKTKFNTYPRISIKIVSEEMINDIRLLLSKLNLKHTFGMEKKNKPNESDAYWIMVRGETNVENWMKIIGFNNSSKQIKYDVWKKFGFCPPNSGILDRKLFLEGKLNPSDFYKK